MHAHVLQLKGRPALPQSPPDMDAAPAQLEAARLALQNQPHSQVTHTVANVIMDGLISNVIMNDCTSNSDHR